MGYQAMEIPTTQIAHTQHLGVGNLSQITVKGQKIENVRMNFMRPMFKYISDNPNVTTYFGGVCCGCIYRIPETENAIGINPASASAHSAEASASCMASIQSN
jgi:hypothetical protein